MKRIVCCALTWFLITVLLSGCGGSVGQSVDGAVENADDEQTGTLSVWVPEITNPVIQDYVSIVIGKYADSRPGITLEVTETGTAEQSVENLANTIRSGEGPDVMFFFHCGHDAVYRDLAKAGLLEDLSPFIKADSGASSLSYDNLIRPLTEQYVVDGKQTALPAGMYVDLFVMSAEAIQTAGLAVAEEGIETDSLLDMETAFAKAVGAGPDTPFVGGINEMICLLEAEGFQDLMGRGPAFDSSGFKALLDSYLQFDRKYPGRKAAYEDTVQKELWKQDGLFLSRGQYADLFRQASQCGKTPFFTFLTQNGGVTASVSIYLSVNANSGSKSAAYDFIRFILLENEGYLGWPVCKTDCQDYIKELVTCAVSDSSSFDFSTGKYKLSAEDPQFSALYELPERITGVCVQDDTIYDMFLDMLADIKENGTPADEAADELQQKVLEYYSAK